MRGVTTLALCAVLGGLLAGCDLLGESSEAVAARKEAEGRAVGSACRHAMRAIEDCYSLNPKTVKSAVFAGWREMDEYMRENKIEGIAPTVAKAGKAAAPAGDAEADEEGAGHGEADGAAAKGAKPAADKHH